MSENNNQKGGAAPQDMNELRKIRFDKLANLQEAGRDPFVITKFDVTDHTTDIKNDFDAKEGTEVSVAGRIMAKRVMGKVTFIELQDREGRIQVYVARDVINTEDKPEEYKTFKTYDIGDIVGVKGEVFKTKTGEISVRAEEITLLSKSLQILPEKFHGLQDIDMRYRQRYVDLIMNENSKNVFIKRSKILQEIRNFLSGRDFMEVETPMLVENAGGAA
ncbi:MAG: lysine--tRNA ligase, partial [Clostridia bacterium]|nr:lysine--tRNA ligase [Clostridia bacterium]